MLKEVAVSSLLLLLSNSGMAGEVPEDRRAVSMAGVLKGREKSKRLGSLISMPGMILKEISKLLLGVTLRFCPTQPYDLYCDINWFILLYKSYLTYNPQAPWGMFYSTAYPWIRESRRCDGQHLKSHPEGFSGTFDRLRCFCEITVQQGLDFTPVTPFLLYPHLTVVKCQAQWENSLLHIRREFHFSWDQMFNISWWLPQGCWNIQRFRLVGRENFFTERVARLPREVAESKMCGYDIWK